ncbi:MAG: hypothetical protein H0T87_00265 [Gammaproteobacteria bacterium]|nr:hypothetical protein [Gammaproteobacteria bacterium]
MTGIMSQGEVKNSLNPNSFTTGKSIMKTKHFRFTRNAVLGLACLAASAQAPAQTCGGVTQATALNNGYTTFQGGAANDTFVDTSGAAIWAHGGGGNDTLESGSGDDIICGGGGNDTITTGDGNDDAFGGTGNDTIYGGRGPDSIYGDDQPGLLPSTVGADVLDGGPDDDELSGGPGSDNLLGKSGTDQLFGDDGNDILNGGTSVGDADEGDGGGGLGDQCVQLEVAAVNCP